MPSESSAAPLLPIREVARLTGVNPVTLRAWERRYGLIVPQRTDKGHRLYSSDQVERVRQVLVWLARGVAVSQVRELLDGRPLACAQGDSPWQQQLDALHDAVSQLAERRLEDLFNRAFSLYPPATLLEHLLLPLLQRMHQRWQGQPGSALEQAFLYGWLRTRLGSRLQQQRRHGGQRLLLASLDPQRDSPALWLTAWLLGELGFVVEVLDSLLPASELLLACERLTPAALLLHGDGSSDAAWLRRQLPLLLEQSPCPLLLGGAAAEIHAAQLVDLPGLILCPHPLQLAERLQSLLEGVTP